ncbi:protein efr3 [Lichtheimia corymbifera JMRC:FSU:9682]|uniref:Protein efr3 n=1 Tax=Lichtheimia corymbifera JMRC:FSU:9682 TaxID=1263082 RepID=A0A068RHT2_9FUNG|nr:protein efr3 [Lichtheimia corymbifera JMRC:FSU:9682]
MHLYVKHATLINNCYPEKEGEKGPRSSELSYLTFYASSRPVKLTKVGTFLEKKVERDVWKNRKQNNQVSLEIIKALIQSCHRDLNLFSKYVVKILCMMLGTQDLELIDLTCDTFIMFSKYHDGSTLGVDAEFTTDFESLIKKFADLCENNNTDPNTNLSMKHIGHRAIQAVFSSASLQTSTFKTQLGILLPPVITTLAASNTPANTLAKNADSVDITKSSINNSGLEKGVIDIMAAKSASILFSQLNGGAVRTALSPLFTYMDNKKKWWPPNFAVSMMELVLDSLQPQNRYLLVSEVLQQLDAIKGNNDDVYEITEKRASLISILDTILNASIPLVGISVLEVLNSLFTHLIKSVHGREYCDEAPDASDVTATYVYAVHQGLAHSIGGLASQTYYQNQLNDIVGYIIAKLRAGTALERVEDLPIEQYRRVALVCLDLIVSTSKESAADDEYNNAGNEISLSSWLPAIGLLTDRIPDTRLDFAATLTRYLELATNEDDLTPDPYPKHLLTQHGDVMFVNAVHQTIIDWVQMPACNVADVGAMYTLLCALTRRFGADGSIRTVPLVFKLQSLVKQGAIKQTSRQRAIAASTIEWFGMVSQMHKISALATYLKPLKEERIAHKEYSPIFIPEVAPSVAHIMDFDDLDPENTTPVDKFIDRHAVVEIISKDGSLRDEDDTHGLDLESKLYAEWGSEAFVSQERSFRIRSSRDLEELKPKLVTPWTGAEFETSERTQKNTINVENLKEALVSQQKTGGNKENGESEGDSLQSMTKRSLAKRPKDTKTDIDSILSSLSLGINIPQPSTSSSLVNPPYKG